MTHDDSIRRLMQHPLMKRALELVSSEDDKKRVIASAAGLVSSVMGAFQPIVDDPISSAALRSELASGSVG